MKYSLFRLLKTSLGLPKPSLKLLLSIFTFIGSMYFTIYCQKISSNKRNKNIPLPDILHTDRLNLSKYYKYTDILINVNFILLFFFFNKNIDKFLFLMSANYVARAISFSSTILPKCGNMKDKDNNRSCTSILMDYITLKDTHTGHNNDLLFSGHVSFCTLFNLYCRRFGYVSNRTSNIMWVINIINSLMIILTRCHYSIDVIYAYITTFVIYKNLINFI